MSINPRWLAWEQAQPEHQGKTYEFLIWMSQRWLAFHQESKHAGSGGPSNAACCACGTAAESGGAFDTWLAAQYPEAYVLQERG